MPSPSPERPAENEERVPLFGTWGLLYAAVLGSAVAVMLLLALFSRWAF